LRARTSFGAAGGQFFREDRLPAGQIIENLVGRKHDFVKT
jgi:hypothetical protein